MTDNRRGYQQAHYYIYDIYIYICYLYLCQLNTLGRTADKSDSQINIVYSMPDVRIYSSYIYLH